MPRARNSTNNSTEKTQKKAVVVIEEHHIFFRWVELTMVVFFLFLFTDYCHEYNSSIEFRRMLQKKRE
ncbi:hypothetical protein L3Y34_010400 [Caenorhabditis briggsae]|uniref:Transmembrane protein n=1 Tax=Caenorhabditis briggsae TaxID=6238 RepID=A0AAE9CT08_CAEBR|nr:hypothetical protein L3Y34_010400 [Caenorhabditis briggsae]